MIALDVYRPGEWHDFFIIVGGRAAGGPEDRPRLRTRPARGEAVRFARDAAARDDVPPAGIGFRFSRAGSRSSRYVRVTSTITRGSQAVTAR